MQMYFHRANEDGEVFMKTLTDCWVVGRKSDQRELYVVLNQKNANLIDVNGKGIMTVLLLVEN